jgi:flagellar hook protein FlgE
MAHSQKMSVLGNNIANVSTTGYKSQYTHFEDFIYQYTATTGASQGQVGRGVSISAITGDFSQGSFETTNVSTNCAIGGNGFFAVKSQTTGSTYYTRAGDFTFDADGYLVNPDGLVVQGWKIPTTNTSTSSTSSSSTTSAVLGTGVPTDIQIDGQTCKPKHTTTIKQITNLSADEGGDNTTSTTNPCFALAETWNGTSDPPLGTSAYAYSSSIKVYDEAGVAHTLTTYYDLVSNTSGKLVWEYIVTCDPSEDNRVFSSGYEPGGTSAAGLLMIGTLTFSSSGELQDMSAYTLPGTATNAKDLSQWRTTALSQDGYPVFAADFTGLSNASWVVNADNSVVTPVLSNAKGKLIEMNFGLSIKNGTTWTNNNIPTSIGSNVSLLPGFGTNAVLASAYTTSYSGSSSTTSLSQNGYPSGYLQSISIDSYGVLSGIYSNGVTLELYQLTLYNFTNLNGLSRQGSNLYAQTLDSGEAYAGAASTNGLGSITSQSLEQSNVDLATEFVQMIATQRGFSANGKIITTADEMLSEVIQLKR